MSTMPARSTFPPVQVRGRLCPPLRMRRGDVRWIGSGSARAVISLRRPLPSDEGRDREGFRRTALRAPTRGVSFSTRAEITGSIEVSS